MNAAIMLFNIYEVLEFVIIVSNGLDFSTVSKPPAQTDYVVLVDHHNREIQNKCKMIQKMCLMNTLHRQRNKKLSSYVMTATYLTLEPFKGLTFYVF